jgi:GNAT superfamily N-acetyltransferase
VIHEGGIRGLWLGIMWRQTFYRRVLLMERALDQPIPEITARVPTVFNLLKGTEVSEYVRFRPDSNPSEIHSRLNQRHWCFVARHKGRIVHACWGTTSQASIDYLARRIQLAPGEVYTYDSFTLPQFRGLNIAPAIRVQVLRYFRDAGLRRVISYVLPENKASIHALEKVGYQPFAMMGWVRLGPWRPEFFRLRRSSENPKVGL